MHRRQPVIAKPALLDTMRLQACRALLAGCCLIAAAAAWGDPQSKSYSSWSINGGDVATVYSVATREVTRLPAARLQQDLAAILRQHLQQTVVLEVAGVRCRQLESRSARARNGYLRVAMRWQCPDDQQPLQLTINTFFAEVPSHIHFARFRGSSGSGFERLFSRRQLQHQLARNTATEPSADATRPAQTVLTYTQFGFEHILIGLDHIAFLLALLLLANRAWDIIFIVTGFTLGHSITLSLTVLGLTTPNLMVVEAFIGFTIAMVAIENLAARQSVQHNAALLLAACLAALAAWNSWHDSGRPVLAMLGLALFSFCYINLSSSAGRARQLRPAITTLFGLIHGFGFANVLLEVGLPGNAVLPALFGFNLGVEVGQIAIVLCLAVAGGLTRKLLPRLWSGAGAWLNAGLCSLGSYWFIQRLYF